LLISYESDYYNNDANVINSSQVYSKKAGSYEFIADKNLILRYTKTYRFESTMPFISTHKVQRAEVIKI